MIQRKAVWFILTVVVISLETIIWYRVQAPQSGEDRVESVLTMQSVSNEVNYIFGKDPADGQIYELKFSVKSDPKTITPIHKKIFSGQDKVDENTLWAFTNPEVFYFSHQDKIYRYNPLNGEIKALEADFKQKNITLLKLKDSDTLIAGTDGYLCFWISVPENRVRLSAILIK